MEFKAAAALGPDARQKTEITKDVSAMANSAGGTLIYGLAQFHASASRHLPERIDPISRTAFSKEWLEHIIAQVRPRIEGLKIHSVQLASGPDYVVYVVEIPPGGTAHQAIDHRYYRRGNFESVPMLDHEIRDVMSRKTHPRVTVGAKFSIYHRPNINGAQGALVVSVTNDTDVFARHVLVVLHSPIRIAGNPIHYQSGTLDNGDDGWAYKLELSNHNGAPLFPRAKLNGVFQFEFSDMKPEPKKQLSYLRWVAFADSMPMQSGRFEINDILDRRTNHPFEAEQV